MFTPSDHGTTVRFAALPNDMRVLIGQLVLDHDPPGAIPETLPLVAIATADLPEVPLDEYDRGSAYALAMDLGATPPILVADGQFLDGKHRLFAARRRGVAALAAIDLSGLVPARLVAANGMGEVGPAAPQPGP